MLKMLLCMLLGMLSAAGAVLWLLLPAAVAWAAAGLLLRLPLLPVSNTVSDLLLPASVSAATSEAAAAAAAVELLLPAAVASAPLLLPVAAAKL